MSVVLALYPNARGLCFACVQLPTTLIDYGIANPLPFSMAKFLQKVERFITFYRPTVVVLRNVEPTTNREKRAIALAESITKLAEERGLPVHAYTRRQVRDVFEIHQAWSKHEIAQKIIGWIPDLAIHEPKPRKFYLPEDHRMGLFDAVALAIAHDYLMS